MNHHPFVNFSRLLIYSLFTLLLAYPIIPVASAAQEEAFYKLSATDISGKEVDFSSFEDKVVLIVNFSSKCGTTPQLEDLQKLYASYKEQGLVVLGFPSEDFGEMDTKTPSEIAYFCRTNYGVEFPVFEKIAVTGADKSPVFRFLTEQGPEALRAEVGFNFEKFLVGRDGQIKARFGAFTSPMSSRLQRVLKSELG